MIVMIENAVYSSIGHRCQVFHCVRGASVILKYKDCEMCDFKRFSHFADHVLCISWDCGVYDEKIKVQIVIMDLSEHAWFGDCHATILHSACVQTGRLTVEKLFCLSRQSSDVSPIVDTAVLISEESGSECHAECGRRTKSRTNGYFRGNDNSYSASGITTQSAIFYLILMVLIRWRIAWQEDLTISFSWYISAASKGNLTMSIFKSSNWISALRSSPSLDTLTVVFKSIAQAMAFYQNINFTRIWIHCRRALNVHQIGLLFQEQCRPPRPFYVI